MSLRRACALVLVAAGLALCAVAVLPYLRGREAQEEGRRALENRRAFEQTGETPAELQRAESPTPTPAEIDEASLQSPAGAPMQHPLVGDPVARLRIPAARIDAVVFEGDDEATLEKGPGHMPQTEQPGRTGVANNCVIIAHRDSYFRNLGWLRPGHRVELETPEAREIYTVVSREVVSPDAVHVLAPTSTRRLTLVTCYPFNYVGPAPSRLVIVAEPEAVAAAAVRR